ncbi:MAG: transcription elongation factor GreAB [Pelovirga sp.]
MNKDALLQQIIMQLEADHACLLTAARSAHAAAIHEESVPENKYDTHGLEASYIAQGQANRARQIALAATAFRRLRPQTFLPGTPIGLAALVELESATANRRLVFLGPAAGGFLLHYEQRKITVITPASPLGRALLGKRVGDLVERDETAQEDCAIIAVW